VRYLTRVGLVALGRPGCCGLSCFRILGPIEVVEGERRLAIGGRRQLTLLAFLLLHANEAVSSDTVSEAIWGSARSGADNRLKMAIARLRQALQPLSRNGEPLLRTVGGGYMLSVGPGELDAEAFAIGVQHGRRALESRDADRASELLVQALALWRGPPLPEVAFEDFAQPEIRRLEDLRLDGVEARVGADLQLGRHAELVSELDGLVTSHPTRESFAAGLMIALYRCGRQADALEAYRRTRVHLAEELGLEPGPTLKSLQAQILEQARSLETGGQNGDAAGQSTSRGSDFEAGIRDRTAASRASLPVAPTATIGRREEVESVCGLLTSASARLVTLIGSGGVGKTRVALEAAHALHASFRDGTCWVELAGVARSEDVASTILRALAVTPWQGETPRDAVCRCLAGKRLLLAIDNFEHVLDAAKLVAELHRACPSLRILVTSREELDLAAEHRVVIAPLAVPAPSEALTVAEIESTDASALFLAAARRHDSRFTVTADTAPAIARICGRLDGLPLALELAAARTGLVGLEELATRLDVTVGDLGIGPRDAPERQRTIEATIEWSFRLLDDEERRAFVRFAVFAGGATVDATQSVTGATLDTIGGLIAKNLLARRPQSDGLTRLVMLETVRHNALARLAGDGAHRAIRDAHYEYYSELADRAIARLSAHDELEALAAIDREIDNIRAALEWALQEAPGDALRLAGRLARYWDIRGDMHGLEWLERAIAAAGERAPAEDLARAQLMRAWQSVWRAHHPPGARESAATALDLYQQVGDDAGIAEAYVVLSYLGADERDVDVPVGPPATEASEIRAFAQAACRHARLAGDDVLLGQALLRLAYALPAGDDRVAALQQGAELLTQAGHYRDVALGYSNAAWVALKAGRTTEAASLLDVALPMAERANTPQITMLTVGNIGWANLFAGNSEAARLAFARQVQLCLDHGLGERAGEGLAGLAAVAAGDALLDRAARLLGAARGMGYPPPDEQPIDERLERDFFAAARASYGPAFWRRAEQSGASLSYEQAIAEALTNPTPSLHL
jgi:predicted ATPase/DNA-binding SARP family transcriptional activator